MARSLGALALALLGLVACGDAPQERAPAPQATGAADEAGPGEGAGAEIAACRAEAERARDAYERRIAALELELANERAARLDRESEWLRYTQAMARLQSLATLPRFEVDAVASASASATAGPPPADGAAPAAPADPAPAAPDPAAEAHAARSREVFTALRSFFAIEHVSGLDLLESGVLHEGATGPVVLRVLDDAGHPLGSLYADRLRLEGSRAARTTTLVLENGWERRAGERLPFEGGPADAEGRGGVRRIELPHVDPTPWFEAVPELFRPEQLAEAPAGDPLLASTLRFELNRLLARDASGAIHRVESLASVEGVVLRDVRLAVLSPDRRVEKELFADRMAVLRAERGLEVLLEGGSQVRGTEKIPFLGGRYRIFLPRAVAEDWAAAGVPLGARDAAGGG